SNRPAHRGSHPWTARPPETALQPADVRAVAPAIHRRSAAITGLGDNAIRRKSAALKSLAEVLHGRGSARPLTRVPPLRGDAGFEKSREHLSPTAALTAGGER